MNQDKKNALVDPPSRRMMTTLVQSEDDFDGSECGNECVAVAVAAAQGGGLTQGRSVVIEVLSW